MGETLKLTETESLILRDICFARIKVMKAGDCDCVDQLPLHTELDEAAVRQAIPAFDFFRCARSGNEDGIKHQAAIQQNRGPHAGGMYYEGMAENYRSMIDALMKDKYTEEDVILLQERLKGYIRSQKKQPARTLYIADCHFYHDRICREMDKRGFPGYEEMNAHMIRQWNRKVTARDDVYILGDFSISKAEATAKILKQLKGKLHLITGNHDKYLQDKHFDRSLFRSVEHYQEIRDNGRTVILSHYPVFCYKGQYRRNKEGQPLTYMLYGHVHDTHDERLVHRFIRQTQSVKVMSKNVTEPSPIPCNMINCFCMFSDYQPMTLDEWIVIDRERRTKLDEEMEIFAPNIGTVGHDAKKLTGGVVSVSVDLEEFEEDDE